MRDIEYLISSLWSFIYQGIRKLDVQDEDLLRYMSDGRYSIVQVIELFKHIDELRRSNKMTERTFDHQYVVASLSFRSLD